MEKGEPKIKRFKHSIISEHMYDQDFQTIFYDNWQNSTSIKSNNIEVIAEPFRVCKISNFLRTEEFMDEIKNELLDVKTRRNSIDLYQFEQSSDLADVDRTNLKRLYETFQTDLVEWMEKNTNVQLNEKISMSSSCYTDTDYLLCHDDNMVDRKIAFILYLSKNWTKEDGGTLDLFNTDENGLPRQVVNSLVPEYNSLVFFEVTHNSYHQVAEVISPDKSRWSINGWFHGPIVPSQRPRRPEPVLSLTEPQTDEVDLDAWVSESYLVQSTMNAIQQDIERESFVFLSDFLQTDVYKQLVVELASADIEWTSVGPADVRNYEVAEENSLPELLGNFCRLFKSITCFKLLKDYTELDLVPEKDSSSNPTVALELQRWRHGCYTLLTDRRSRGEGAAGEAQQEQQPEPQPEPQIEPELEIEPVLVPEDQEFHLPIDEPLPRVVVTPPSSSNSDGDDEDEEDSSKFPPKQRTRRLKKRFVYHKTSPPKAPQPSLPQASSSRIEMELPLRVTRNTDTDDSDVSDIGDYLSDPLDCSDVDSRQDKREEEEEEEPEPEEPDEEEADNDDASRGPGSLDVIMQFQTQEIRDRTIDYVEPGEEDGALIHVPCKDNHLCLVYNNQGTCRLHKYIDHYVRGYFYNLVCTYYE